MSKVTLPLVPSEWDEGAPKDSYWDELLRDLCAGLRRHARLIRDEIWL